VSMCLQDKEQIYVRVDDFWLMTAIDLCAACRTKTESQVLVCSTRMPMYACMCAAVQSACHQHINSGTCCGQYARSLAGASIQLTLLTLCVCAQLLCNARRCPRAVESNSAVQ
jgi:hypothetical protein